MVERGALESLALVVGLLSQAREDRGDGGDGGERSSVSFASAASTAAAAEVEVMLLLCSFFAIRILGF